MQAFDIGYHKGIFSDFLLNNGYKKIIGVDPMLDDTIIFNNRILIKKALDTIQQSNKKLYLNNNEKINTINEKFVNTSRYNNNFHYKRLNYFTKDFVLVDTTTYNNLVDLYGIPDLLKLDIEGHETEILNNIDKNFPNIITFEFHQEFLDDYLYTLERLIDKGYKYFHIQSFLTKEYIEIPIQESYKLLTIENFKNNFIINNKYGYNLNWGMVWLKKLL